METSSHEQSFAAWQEHKSRPRQETDFLTHEILRQAHPSYHVTRTSPAKCDLLGYGRAGYATATQIVDAGYDATRIYKMPISRLEKTPGQLEDVVGFGRWAYQWQSNEFIVYEVSYVDRYLQTIKLLYILAPETPDSVQGGHHAKTDELLLASGQWTRELHEEIWIYDNAQWRKK